MATPTALGNTTKPSNSGEVTKKKSGKEAGDVVMIARNKHWRNIAAYHGPWLQLPAEMLEYLCQLNATAVPYSLDAARANEAFIAATRDEAKSPELFNSRARHRMVEPPVLPPPKGVPRPAIDPIVLADLVYTRELVDEASELVVEAARAQLHTHGSGGGASINIHTRRRLLRQAVEKMAAAYRTDEIATSVCAMQGAVGLDELIDSLAKISPDDSYTNDATYTHFFHEKIPSRRLATSTSVEPLDELIRRNPDTAEYYRTRGTMLCIKGQHAAAIKDFATAMQLARKYSAPQRRRFQHPSSSSDMLLNLEDDEAEVSIAGNENSIAETSPLFVLSDDLRRNPLRPGRGTKRQALFQRGSCYLQWAFYMIRAELQDIEKGIEEKHRAAKAQQLISKNANENEQNSASKKTRRQRRKKSSGERTSSGGFGTHAGTASADDVAWDVEPHSTPISPLDNELREACHERLTSLIPRVTSLARRAIRDYTRFLRWFPNSLPDAEKILEELDGEGMRASRHITMNRSTSAGIDTNLLQSTLDESQSNASNKYLSDTTNNNPTLKPVPFSAAIYRSYFSDADPIQIPNLALTDFNPQNGSGPSVINEADKMTQLPLNTAEKRNLFNNNGLIKEKRSHPSDLDGHETDNSHDIDSVEVVWDDGFPHVTYHPLLVETHYSIAIAMLLLGDWPRAVAWHVRGQLVQHASTGYPIFMPARSVARSDFCEITERAQAFIAAVSEQLPVIATKSNGTSTTDTAKAADLTAQKLHGCQRLSDQMYVAARWLQRRRVEEAVAQARQRSIAADAGATSVSSHSPLLTAGSGYPFLSSTNRRRSEPFAVSKLGGVPLYSCRVRITLAWMQVVYGDESGSKNESIVFTECKTSTPPPLTTTQRLESLSL
ncbi:hypothetical protein BDF19DRAFT_142039 [Syncephalis fuscata]|nr:hypothetical protein BDF19DRAFT_142039 [Syncephalis fuscata]